MIDFFSDRELGKNPAILNDINLNVWNGIVAIIDSFIADNSFSKDFPEQCQDGHGVCGCNATLFYDKLKALIPSIEIPIRRLERIIKKSYGSDFEEVVEELEANIDTYATLDLIEFCYRHISDANPVGDFHDYFRHHHYIFKDTGIGKVKFREEINLLFERNGIAYKLNSSGKIERIVSLEFQRVLKRSFSTKDGTLNQLLSDATQNILLPKQVDRIRAIEKLWDAFERAKTFYSVDKKISASQLITVVSNGNALIETYLQTETKTLTEIGNRFQIRHFETDKEPINDLSHIDYLFFRMYSILDLFIKELEK